MKLFAFKAIRLGDFTAQQFTLFECKRLFSLIFYHFSGDGWQDRYHDHAFHAVSFRLWGTYQEEIVSDGVVSRVPRNSRRVKFFRKGHVHRLGFSTGCVVLLVAGPWGKTWREIKDGRERVLTWGRRTVSATARNAVATGAVGNVRLANVVNNCLFGRGLTLTLAPRRRGWYVVEVAVERQGPSLPPELPNTDEDRAMRGVTR